jgi:hypothetical protein
MSADRCLSGVVRASRRSSVRTSYANQSYGYSAQETRNRFDPAMRLLLFAKGEGELVETAHSPRARCVPI